MFFTKASSRRSAGLFAISFFSLALKSPDSLSLPQFWAEDGSVFFHEQFGNHSLHLFTPHGGTLQVVPRLVAWFASFFDMAQVPLVYNFAALIGGAVAITFLIDRLSGAVPAPVIWASIFLVPTNGEIFGTLTNAQWVMNWALLPACFLPPGDVGPNETTLALRNVLAFIAVLALALTGPFSIFYALAAVALTVTRLALLGSPFAATWGVSVNKAVKALSPSRLAALGLGACVQFLFKLTTDPTDWPHLQVFDLVRRTLGALLPLRLTGVALLRPSLWLLFDLALLAAVLSARKLALEWRIVLVLGFAVGVFEALAGVAPLAPDLLRETFSGDRNFMFAKLTFWWLLYAAVSSIPRLARAEAAGLTLGALVLIAIENPVALRRTPFPDLQWGAKAHELSEPGHHDIVIFPGWTVPLDTPAK